MSILTFHVQADRVTSDDPKTTSWVAVKISARLDRAVDPAAYPNAERPWHWLNSTGTSDWIPHEKENWQVWKISIDRTAVPPALNISKVAVRKAISVDLPDPTLITALDAAVDEVAANAEQLPASLRDNARAPGEDLQGSVMGFVERLALVPHPVPSGARIHALLEVDAVDEDTCFIAAPRVKVDGIGVFDPPDPTVAPDQPGLDPDDLPLFYEEKNGGDFATLLVRTAQRSKASDPDSPIDALDQTIAIDPDPAQNFATADALAALPQKLAAALDPLARLRSVLEPVTRRWLHADGDDSIAAARLAALRSDIGTTGRLKTFLDLVALQVLGPRSDKAGRFEVPMFKALDDAQGDTSSGRAATRLRDAHFNSLPADLPVAPGDAGRDVKGVIGAALRVEYDAELASSLSPFTTGYLKHLAGIAADDTDKAPGDELAAMHGWWLRPGPALAGAHRVRYLELAAASDVAGPLMLEFELQDPGFDSAVPSETAFDNALVDAIFLHERENAALVFGAPFIEGIVSGLVNWHDQKAPRNSKAALSERFAAATRTLLGGLDGRAGLFDTWRAKALALGGGAADPVMDSLIAPLAEAAIEEAAAIAGGLSTDVDPIDMSTPLPLPLAIGIDQLRTFPRGIDWWARFAGYGLLVRRSGYHDSAGTLRTATQTDFVSLNPASLSIGGTAITGQGSGGARAFVDPHPYSPSDGIGVTDAVAEYGNQWATAPMPGRSELRENSDGYRADKTVIGYGAPPVGNGGAVRMATLSFGYSYAAVGHLVVLGGVLAPALRAKGNPYVFGPLGASDVKSGVEFENYLRTRGIGVPTFRMAAPTMPKGLALLADELPRRLAPRSAKPGFRANYDPNTATSQTGWAGDAIGGLRFELVIDNPAAAVARLSVFLSDNTLEIPIDVPAHTAGYWVAIEIDRGTAAPRGWQQCSVAIRTRMVGNRAEDELRIAWSERTVLAAQDLPLDGVFLTLASTSDDLTVEYAGATPLPLAPPVPLEGGPPVPAAAPPTAATRDPKRQATLLLDGLDTFSNRFCPVSVRVRIDAPATDRYSWERWINSALFASTAPAGMRDKVAGWLVEAQREAPPAEDRPGPDKPDPAVGGLWVELWETFPVRRRIGTALRKIASESGLLGGIDMIVQVGSPAALKDDGSTATCQAGHVYEIRASAAIDPDAMPFDGLRPNIERFGKAIREGLAPVRDGTGKRWLLASPAVLPVEVATVELPVLAPPNVRAIDWHAKHFLRKRDIGPDRNVDLFFGTRVFDGDGRRQLRYCDIARLVPQRWSWRGLPHVYDPDLAFIDRSEGDVGAYSKGALHAVHGFGQQADEPLPAEPVSIVSRELDWRGGWNLWRFGLQFVSRYAPLFRDTPRSVLDFLQTPSYRWLPYKVDDRDNGRLVARPAPMLVIPLTEADDDSNGLVPPLLALFNGTMFENDHFGDGIAVAMEMVRHPLPAVGKQKYLPQVGPDPIRSIKGHDGTPVPLSIEGPIGYGFDRIAGTSRFDHFGCIITPISDSVGPWTMLMLKFRRLEETGSPFIVVPFHAAQEPSNDSIKLTNFYALSGAGALPDDPAIKVRYDGLCVPLTVGSAEKVDQLLEFYLARDRVRNGRGLRVSAVRKNATLTIKVWSLPDRGNKPIADEDAQHCGTYETVLSYSGLAEIRVIASSSPRPQQGERWKPSADIMIQLSEAPGGKWLTLFCMPIDLGQIEVPIDQEAELHCSYVTSDKELKVTGVRASPFTTPVWCQVTVASSRIAVAGGIGHADVRDLRLEWNRKKTGATLILRDENGRAVTAAPDWISEDLEEVRIAMLTRKKSDIAARTVETPIAAFILDDNASKNATCLWWNDADSALVGTDIGSEGRWRLIRMTVRKGQRAKADFNLASLLAEPLDSMPAQPGDAPGAITTVSWPSSWISV